jgi:hypothetical protein
MTDDSDPLTQSTGEDGFLSDFCMPVFFFFSFFFLDLVNLWRLDLKVLILFLILPFLVSFGLYWVHHKATNNVCSSVSIAVGSMHTTNCLQVHFMYYSTS